MRFTKIGSFKMADGAPYVLARCERCEAIVIDGNLYKNAHLRWHGVLDEKIDFALIESQQAPSQHLSEDDIIDLLDVLVRQRARTKAVAELSHVTAGERQELEYKVARFVHLIEKIEGMR